MNRSENINELAAALATAQGTMTNVIKGSRAKITMRDNKGEYSYTYADLGDIFDMIRKPLADNGLALLQVPSVSQGYVEVETVVAHTSGQWASCTVGMAVNTGDPKAIGSGITYDRRYGMAIIGIVTDDDDDAQAASKPAVKSAQRPQVVQPPAQSAPTNGKPPEPAYSHAMLGPESPADKEFNMLVPSPLSAAGQEEKPAKPEFTICPLHSLPMQLRKSKTGGEFYSHRLENGDWCNGTTVRKPTTQPAA